MLEEDALRFDQFLKDNDQKAVQAIKRAEAETKAKSEKVAEIKKLNMQITQIKSEMSKFEEQLEDCRKYGWPDCLRIASGLPPDCLRIASGLIEEQLVDCRKYVWPSSTRPCLACKRSPRRPNLPTGTRPFSTSSRPQSTLRSRSGCGSSGACSASRRSSRSGKRR